MELQSVHQIARVLQEAEIRYLVVGGLAVNAHGYQRFTNDLDLVINLIPANIQLALEKLATIGYLPRVPVTPAEFAVAENRKQWHEEKDMLVLNLFSDQHRRTPIDVFISEPFDFVEEWKNALQIPIDDLTTIPVIRLSALLKMKEEAGREKDLLDISYLNKLSDYHHDEA
ncbi:MAG: hypothetical protein NWT08_09985 [Akkermansiaceae bacterium]|jgi:hypothetical protein|nr:hypothetical protein [Akkermansiaceae bacterium]MDP4721214.1 hypothetical protein [Akkermansiaceae bacterium]MDP4778862.1 hypothetical protein [Akkermansiaceae bacterium]MDP4846937.1 hypothetical protein [Akkermansiaceae bacterium]MDP4897925.1 hypothetical protein [Akkermansiaceae bacterium]